jgi:DNA-binding beta-propeller fold protein YncE
LNDNRHSWHRLGAAAALLAGPLVVGLAFAAVGHHDEPVPDLRPAKEASAYKDPDKVEGNRIISQGLAIEFSAKPAGASEPGTLMEGNFADVAFQVTDAASGEPVSGLFPIAWMDAAGASLDTMGSGEGFSCRARVQMYLRGLVGMRPMIDLNSYFVMVMNRDPTISVIDPILGVAGMTNLYAQVVLKRAGADWAKTADERRLFVSQPVADLVGLVDAEKFVLTHQIVAGKRPTRVMLQPDEKYLWVGNDARGEDQSGVTVVDVEALRVAKFIPTGAGHHEILVTPDNRYAFASNRDAGTVTAIAVAALEKVKTLAIGGKPVSLAYSSQSEALYVAVGDVGEIAVFDGRTLEKRDSIRVKRGLGPLRFSRDGRWGVGVNPVENEAYVIDAATGRLAHTLSMKGRPFQVAFSDAFAYVRALESTDVRLINLGELAKGGKPVISTVPVGTNPMAKARDLVLADTMAPAPGEAAMLFGSPADMSIQYYTEGMNAPMGSFQTHGHAPREVSVIDRTIKEREPGVYAAKVRVPQPGEYVVAFLLDTPGVLHCFTATAVPNPSFTREVDPLAVSYLVQDRNVKVGKAYTLRFKLTDPATNAPREALEDVRVRYMPASGGSRRELSAKAVGDGVYEAELVLKYPGAYYVYVGAHSLEMPIGKLPYTTLVAVR